MELTVFFLISCVLIARKFEKQKMQLASLAYSVMFIVIMIVLLFTVDLDIVRRAMLNVLGEKIYGDVNGSLLEAMNTPFYGVSVVGALTVTAIVQFLIAVLDAARAVVCYCFFAKKSIARKFKKAYFRFARSVRSLYLPKRINLLYCRMLN